MLNLKLEFEELIQELRGKDDSEVYKLNVLTYENPIMFAGIDPANHHRQLYIDLGPGGWDEDQEKALPKWRGMSVKVEYFEKLSLLKEHYFLVIRQEDEQSPEIFELVLQNLADHLAVAEEEGSLFSTVYKVLDRWRTFFQRGGFKRLSEEQQRGLFGELWFINEWLEKHPGQPPLIIEHWEGPTKGRIDFKGTRCGIEIKTIIEKLSKTIKISNENQLKLNEAVSSIYLYVCFLEQSRTHGLSLQELAGQVRVKLAERSERIALIYSDLLTDLGFREEEYEDVLYFMEKTEVYEAGEKFPRLIKEHLPKGISHVSYNIDLTHCSAHEKQLETIYQLFRVEG
ncbi:PD-(D/E)XK motif protein [Bacillus safensis]|uniref:PD-(D/E)XK motif protein n=1 Tax=Bacillus safensis TaxID=561879 RepID=UPI0022813A74|nr:PD-(D/E)XK motif protein [Bacillus safensis]MCY7705922.1 PD-(D/E)XK motif protein [Bacillus safensis]MCY7720182.1 PD-(D/E)XK motif protein [Bacillus safensis]MED0729626.1 PD-(D/E)XK motif protein [Bacillus safensis]